MSETMPRSNPRLENFEAKKAEAEAETARQAYEESLYADAGTTDFSDEARQRIEEADAYERYMEEMAQRPTYEPGSADEVRARIQNMHDLDGAPSPAFEAEKANIEAKFAADVKLRQMDGIAGQLAELRSASAAEANTERLNDLQSRLTDLLVRYASTDDFDPDMAALIEAKAKAKATATPESTPVDDDLDDEPEDGHKDDEPEDDHDDDLDDEPEDELDDDFDDEPEDAVETDDDLDDEPEDGHKDDEPEDDHDDDTTSDHEDDVDEDEDDDEEAHDDDETSEIVDDRTVTPEEYEAAHEEALRENKWYRQAFRRLNTLFNRARAEASIRLSELELREKYRGHRGLTWTAFGAVALTAGAIAAWKLGAFDHFTKASSDAAQSGGGPKLVDANVYAKPQNGTDAFVPPHSGPSTPDISTFSETARTVDPGEGWISTLKQMGIPARENAHLLPKILHSDDPAIKEWVYKMSNGNPGLSHPGNIPASVLESVNKLR